MDVASCPLFFCQRRWLLKQHLRRFWMGGALRRLDDPNLVFLLDFVFFGLVVRLFVRRVGGGHRVRGNEVRL